VLGESSEVFRSDGPLEIALIERNEATFGALVVAATKQACDIETTGIFAKGSNDKGV
jgi:hypothetical protein